MLLSLSLNVREVSLGKLVLRAQAQTFRLADTCHWSCQWWNSSSIMGHHNSCIIGNRNYSAKLVVMMTTARMNSRLFLFSFFTFASQDVIGREKKSKFIAYDRFCCHWSCWPSCLVSIEFNSLRTQHRLAFQRERDRKKMTNVRVNKNSSRGSGSIWTSGNSTKLIRANRIPSGR